MAADILQNYDNPANDSEKQSALNSQHVCESENVCIKAAMRGNASDIKVGLRGENSQ